MIKVEPPKQTYIRIQNVPMYGRLVYTLEVVDDDPIDPGYMEVIVNQLEEVIKDIKANRYKKDKESYYYLGTINQ